MEMRNAIFVLGTVVLLSVIAARATAANERRIRVLIVDGYSNHDWQQTTKLIRGVIEPTGLFEVAVSTAPPTAQSPGWDQWRPKFADYDVVIQTCNDIKGGPAWPAALQADFEAFVNNGGGVYVFHAGNNAFPAWPAYNEMIGLGWRTKEQGIALTIDKEEKIVPIAIGQGQGTGHGPRTDVVVHRLGDHAIHAGMPRAWMAADIEVYNYARGPAKNIEVLSYGLCERTKMNWPLEWTTTFGQGRVYTSTFGHVWKGDVQPKSMRCAGVQTLLPRVLQWLAKRPVDAPIAADFPTESAVSLRTEIKVVN
ncbi:MAG: ThuA domain-containing protein [Burkholderiales bacterium]|nr:ThuA domain-containing protein [Phycisphaerae bacterium]